MRILILFIMLFLHIVDDYYLQGVLAKYKQRSWWEENAPDPLYKNDYKVALVEHAFSWTFMIMLPIMIIMIYTRNILAVEYIIMFIFNLIVHAWTDHLKANVGNCSLFVDQVIHFSQIFITWCCMTYKLVVL